MITDKEVIGCKGGTENEPETYCVNCCWKPFNSPGCFHFQGIMKTELIYKKAIEDFE